MGDPTLPVRQTEFCSTDGSASAGGPSLAREAPTQPFADMALFSASRLDAAHELIARLVNPHQIRVLGDAAQLLVSFNGVRDSQMNFLHIQYGAHVAVRPDESREYFFVQTTLQGASRVVTGGREIDAPQGHTVVVSPGRPYHMRIGAGTQRLVVSVRVAMLEQQLTRLCGRAIEEPLEFFEDQHSEAAAAIWYRHVANLYWLFRTNPVSYSNEACRRQHYDATCTLLLNLFTHSHSETLANAAEPLVPRQWRSALDYMRHNCRRELTIAEVAEQVGVSVRALEMAFLRHYDATPFEMLRNLRLDAVMVALQRAARDGSGNVTRILLDHGVTSFGHFARQFRRRFGVTPCDVIRERTRPAAPLVPERVNDDDT
jgi:AraC-like DNA-binding protein